MKEIAVKQRPLLSLRRLLLLNILIHSHYGFPNACPVVHKCSGEDYGSGLQVRSFTVFNLCTYPTLLSWRMLSLLWFACFGLGHVQWVVSALQAWRRLPKRNLARTCLHHGCRWHEVHRALPRPGWTPFRHTDCIFDNNKQQLVNCCCTLTVHIWQ